MTDTQKFVAKMFWFELCYSAFTLGHMSLHMWCHMSKVVLVLLNGTVLNGHMLLYMWSNMCLSVKALLLGPFHGAIAVPSVTRCRPRRRGHRTPPAL